MYHSKTLLAKQGTIQYKVWPDSAVKRGILNPRILDITGSLTLTFLFIDVLLVISENRSLYLLDSGTFMDGRNKEKRVGKLKINCIVCQSVIYLSGRTEGSEF